jgi:carboxypeptidase Q
MTRAVVVGVAMAMAMVMSALAPVSAQTFTSEPDPVLRAIWTEGNERSRLEPLAHALLDSVGPRLTGSPGQDAAHEWAVRTYGEWGIVARREQYGTWRGWRRGITHVDLLEPRVRTLEAMALAWSPPSGGPVVADVVIPPAFGSEADLEAWLPSVSGKFVLVSFAQPTCRPDDNWAEWATDETLERIRLDRQAGAEAWQARFAPAEVGAAEFQQRLDQAGAAGILTNRWSMGWGVDKVFGASTSRTPVIDLGCEDYGLVFRLAESGAAPVIRAHVEAEFLGDLPVFNTIATIPGTELPDEYIVLSAHFDSWDGASGATDNGTGTITMMEAMRILKQVYPNPRRTIVAGHWSGEEQGLNGSGAFAADHPEIVDGLQALFNQDNGTGRVARISMQGFTGAGAAFERWLGRVPTEITRHIELTSPGTPGGGGSDYASFVCYGAPAFSLGSLSWDYGTYTWHTNRDTYDKIAFDEVRNNAVITAMLTYLASEDPVRMSREQVDPLPINPRTGERMTWPECRMPAREAR